MAGGPTAAAKTSRGRGIGYDYVHAAVDDHSRLAYAEILADEKGTTCAAFLDPRGGVLRRPRHRPHRARDDRQRQELPQLRRIPGRLPTLGARQKFTRPHCPWTNGKVERFNRTLQAEWAYHQVFASNTERADALTPWLHFYNTRRRHTALGGQPPITRLSPKS